MRIGVLFINLGVNKMRKKERNRSSSLNVETLEDLLLLSGNTILPRSLRHVTLTAGVLEYLQPEILKTRLTAANQLQQVQAKSNLRHRKSLVTAWIDSVSDPDGDSLLTESPVKITGRVIRPSLKVRLDLDSDGSFEQTTRADAQGRFSFVTHVRVGVTPVRVQAVYRCGLRPTTTFTVNRANVSTPTIDQFLLPDALRLVGVSAEGFNSTSAPLVFEISSGTFYPGLDQVSLTVNGQAVSESRLALDSSRITATGVLSEGRNAIALSAFDFEGRPLYLNTTIVAGSRTLTVNLLDKSGAPMTQAVVVQARLADDQAFSIQADINTGQIVFNNVPDRTILIQGNSEDGRQGLIGVTGNQGTVNLKLVGFNSASSIDNNAFSQGTLGWDIGSAPVEIVPHVESLADRSELKGVQPLMQSAVIKAAAEDKDLVVNTSGEGVQSISRTFATKPGTTSVKVRYRFITSEVPGGYFGSKYNDYFHVLIRSQQGGGSVEESNNMNGLGLAAFDSASGATAWRDRTLLVNKPGDTIQVDVSVRNVGDGAYDSQVVVDFVEEKACNVAPSLAWNATQGGLNLNYKVVDKATEENIELKLYWANGTSFTNRLGSALSTEPEAFYTFTVPKGTAVGSHNPVHVLGNFLKDAPAEATHLIAVCDEDNVATLSDVRIGYGNEANKGAISAATIDLLKDLLRMAGRSQLTVNSTARKPEDQARAMFNNLVHPGDTSQQIQTRINKQKNGVPGTNFTGYGAAGDAVIDVFAAKAQGKTAQQVLAVRVATEAAMVQEINKGPSKVSKHCADTNVLYVVDIGIGVGQLFFNAANNDSRVSKILDEPNNGCYHLEIPQ